MTKYKINYADTFFAAMDKLDHSTQKTIAKWIDKHLVNTDFPKAPGKHLKGNLSDYIRFRIGSYRIIAIVDERQFIITNVHVGLRSNVYKFH
jgi:mRNA interferase RelE/StbE